MSGNATNTKSRPRFVQTTPQDKELSRYVVRLGDHTLGQVASKRWGQASTYWLAYPYHTPTSALRDPDPRAQGPIPFLSCGKATNALILAADQPDQLPTAEAESRARHPSGGGPR